MAHLNRMRSLKDLSLDWMPITDEEVKALSSHPSLERLDIHKTKVTNEALVHVCKMRSLKVLKINSTQIDAKGLAHLRGMDTLEHLDVPYTADTDEGWAHIGTLKGLRHLRMQGSTKSPASDRGLAHLVGLDKLETLDIGGAGITDEGLSFVTGLPNLTSLSFSFCPGITDEGLAKLGALRSLKSLKLPSRGAKITVAGLNQLNALSNLTRLDAEDVARGDAVLNISNLTKLETFRLRLQKNSSLQDEDLACIGRLNQLRTLRLNVREPNSQLTDKGVAHLRGLTSLEFLSLRGLGLTDEGLMHLANMRVNMRMLTGLTIIGNFTDAGLRHLEQLKSLSYLRINTSKQFSPAALERLRRNLPNLIVLKTESNRVIHTDPLQQSRALEVGALAPSFRLKTLDGREIKLEDYRGKVVVLYFWSTSCAPCLVSMPKLNQFNRKMRQKHKRFVMLGLCLDTGDLQLRRDVKEKKIDWPQALLGQLSPVAADYGVTGAPAYFLIGPDGKIVLTKGSDWDDIETIIAKLLAKK